jgi:hypothetical protein
VVQHIQTDAEKAMKANADSRKRQGARSDRATRKAAEAAATSDPPPSADLTGPGGDPAEGKR